MATVRDLIRSSLLEIQAIGYADGLDSDLADVALQVLKDMVDQYQADSLLLFTVARTLYTLTASQQTRTIGATGNFVGAVPETVSFMGVIPVGEDYELEVVPYENREEWFAEPLKTLTDLYPSRYLYEPTSPTLGTFTFWPIPTTAAQVAISSPVALTTPATLNTVLTYQPGYSKAWRLNLAKELCRPLGRPLTQDLKDDAEIALGIIRRANDPGPPRSRCDEAIAGAMVYDIRSGTFR